MPALLNWPLLVGLNNVYNDLQAQSATNVKNMDVTVKEAGGISPPLDNALRKMPTGIEIPHDGIRTFLASPIEAVARLV